MKKKLKKEWKTKFHRAEKSFSQVLSFTRSRVVVAVVGVASRFVGVAHGEAKKDF
jgi:hypothetical protein